MQGRNTRSQGVSQLQNCPVTANCLLQTHTFNFTPNIQFESGAVQDLNAPSLKQMLIFTSGWTHTFERKEGFFSASWERLWTDGGPHHFCDLASYWLLQIKAWEEAETDKPMEIDEIRVDPSPFQLVERTSLHKVGGEKINRQHRGQKTFTSQSDSRSESISLPLLWNSWLSLSERGMEPCLLMFIFSISHQNTLNMYLWGLKMGLSHSQKFAKPIWTLHFFTLMLAAS